MLRTDRLISLRKSKGLIQQDMADFLQITRPAYVRYERGNNQPPNETLAKLASFFGVSIDYLLGNTDDPTPLNAQKKPLSLEEIEAMYLQALIDNNIIGPGNPLTEEKRKRLEDSVKLAIRIATEQALKDE